MVFTISRRNRVATVLTVYGIETTNVSLLIFCGLFKRLQQYLPFTVLKRISHPGNAHGRVAVATVLTVYGIETLWMSCPFDKLIFARCNSTYRLRY